MPNTLLLVSFYIVEFSALLIAMAVYKKGDRSFPVFLGTLPGFVLLFAVCALAVSTLFIVHHVRNSPPGRTKRFAAVLILNIWSVALAFAGAEALVRVFAVSTPDGRMLANIFMLPKRWESVAAQNRALLEKASAQGSYLVYDIELGWTVGPSRQSGDYNREYVGQLLRRYPESYRARHQPADADAPRHSIYLSSTEGIRSPRIGMSFRNLPASHRIAIVGDSFTFGLEVPYEETWGHQLELALGSEFQVLNFGVDGYGVDQAYLRYRRDVLPWRPDIVILGVINDDLRRTMCVYGFLCFGGGSQIPFPKPRLIMRGNELVALNLPLPTPDSVLAKTSIKDLPFIEHDRSFDDVEWDWRFYHRADSIRFLLSKYRRWSVPGQTVTDEALKSVNEEIVRSFVRLAHENGSLPIVVFFPSSADFMRDSIKTPGVAREVLQASRISYLDMTDCVSKVSSDERFVTLHYSPITNAAVAACLQRSILSTQRISRRAYSRLSPPSATEGGAATR